ncbi:MAG: thiamine pyrophosphate protein domain protein TPP-binding protein [Phycisphaerales bacterium]|nr:thiamine pyrophosphate protein domain protein TPP-binding protein [Phycisphaerales bacterium]
MSLPPTQPLTVLKPADFASDQDVRWCPGCGDYAILAQMKKVCAKLGMDRSKTVFVSGIGCSSRFPYYMNTYGFHSIHGRAPTFATGLKLARPDLNVWMVTGDGDALSIGGNHFMHLVRRNVDIKVLLFNNRIYGLTKGQYSPTSEHGKKTKSTPMGAPEYPIRPISIAIGAEASFAARAIDVDMKHLEYVLERAAAHKGTAFVEIYQNCNIFNDGAYDYAVDKTTRSDNVVYLEHGKPLIFGKENSKGIRLHALTPEVVETKIVSADDLLIHDEKAPEPSLAFLLSRMRYPDFPEPLGVFRAVDHEAYGDTVRQQNRDAVARQGEGDLQSLLNGEETWSVS